ncbi:hypothetical protein ABOM_002987 [Aspergillus bombycis]|uniref:Transcription factor domain-containing protein n=1 Tax=Aspergillus bombycis TaxID=109264 RepID=A0A1F8AAZ2_9EURO|nr:hypothetical protein ABOM_002987 [Aspergillus bombycis]OGM48863.1 hypothetical protein ABOM_002987 [Aspergillus bombycis]
MEPQQPKCPSIDNAAQASGAPNPYMGQSPDDLETISAAYQVLFYVKRSASFQQLLDSLPPDTPGFLMKPLICSFLAYLTQSQLDTSLGHVNTRIFETVDRVFHNSKVPPRWLANYLSSRGHTPQGLDGQDCLRWDVIGIIYSTVALSLTIRHDLSDFDSDASQPGSWARETILKDLTHAVNTCIRFQEMTGTKTELYLWLLIQDLMLLIRIYGGQSESMCLAEVRGYWKRTIYYWAAQTIFKEPGHYSDAYPPTVVLDSIYSGQGYNNTNESTTTNPKAVLLGHSLSSPASLVEKASFVMSVVREDAQVARSTLHGSQEGSAPENMNRLLEGVWQWLKVSSGVQPESWQMESLPNQGYGLLIAYLEYLYTKVYIWQHLLYEQVYTLGEMCRKTLETMICGAQSLGRLEEYRSDYAWRVSY